MPGPSSNAKQRPPREPRTVVPHPKDEADIRAGIEEAQRGEMMSVEESEAYLRALLGEGEPAAK